ncbi:hypothetical protein GOP47_0002412, partial [Adiantum capillus-veneris]
MHHHRQCLESTRLGRSASCKICNSSAITPYLHHNHIMSDEYSGHAEFSLWGKSS